MAIHQFTVRDVVRETPRAVIVRLEAGPGKLSYKAGQAAMVGLAGRPARQPYSIASPPEAYRQRGVLEFLVEVRPGGRFGPHLRGVRPGRRVEVEGPVGGFVLPRTRRREMLFVAGGTGIAPLRAMITSALAGPRAPGISLLYSARTPKEFAFRRELTGAARRGRLRLCLTATREHGSSWRGRTGRIQQTWIDALAKGRSPLCFVCGPEPFVVTMIAMLREAGVPARDIRRERY